MLDLKIRDIYLFVKHVCDIMASLYRTSIFCYSFFMDLSSFSMRKQKSRPIVQYKVYQSVCYKHILLII